MDDVTALVELIATSPAIEIVRIKDRFTTPSGGWTDVMINYRVKGTTHVCEVQIAHAKMILHRKAMGGHEAYA
eukprot:4552432-Prymnesium_polylepis.1